MCTLVEVDGVICDFQAELMDALGTADLVPDTAHGYGDDDIQQAMCLCPVDIEATAAKHGYRAERGWTEDCMCDWRMVPNSVLDRNP